MVHQGLLEMDMYAFRIETLAPGDFIERAQSIAGDIGSARYPGYAKAVATTGDVDVQAALYLPQVFVELPAEVGETVVIGWLENDVPADLNRVQVS
jgi:hypothetical protein